MTVNMKFLTAQLTSLILLTTIARCNSIKFLNVTPISGECGVARSPYDRIVRGRDVGYMKYPWFGTLLLRSMNDRLMCGGSLITNRHIVTAAHCFKPFLPDAQKMMSKSGAGEKNWLSTVINMLNPSSGSSNSIFSYSYRTKPLKDLYHVRLGVNNICENEKSQETYTTTRVFLHEGYIEKMPFYDIAILELDRNVTDLMPICIPEKRVGDNDRQESGIIVGLGKLGVEIKDLPCKVQEANVLTFNDTVCTNILESMNETLTYKANIFCAGYLSGKVDSCQGDSGGPLQMLDIETQKYYLNGLTSFGYGCAKKDVLGIYTDVSAYIDWIQEKVKISWDSINNGNASSRMNEDGTYHKNPSLSEDVDSRSDVQSINIPPKGETTSASAKAENPTTAKPQTTVPAVAPNKPVHKKIKKKVVRKNNNNLERLLQL